ALAAPGPQAPISREPAQLAITLQRTTDALRQAIRAWPDKSSAAPNDVTLLALYQQRIYRLLVRNAGLARATLPRLGDGLRRVSLDLIAAQRGLYVLTPPIAAPTIRVGRPRPASVLLTY